MKTINYDPLAGSHIHAACAEASRISKSQRVLVRCDFNGHRLTASPKKSVATLRWEYAINTTRAIAAYHLTESYRRSQALRKITVQMSQDMVDEAMSFLVVGTDEAVVMRCLRNIAKYADDVDVELDCGVLASRLIALGYSENAHVGDVAFDTRTKLAEYIAGQVINCANIGMSPHPITTKFVEQYFALAVSSPLPPVQNPAA